MSMEDIVEGRPEGEFRIDGDGIHVPSRVFSVLASSEPEAVQMIIVRKGINRGTPYVDCFDRPLSLWGVTGGNGVVCTVLRGEGKPPAPLGQKTTYKVTIEYTATGKNNQKQPTPGGPVVWSPRSSLVTRQVDIDANGDPIFTSSEEPVDPPLSRFDVDRVLHGEFFVQAADEIQAYQPFLPYETTVNSSPFFGAPKGCALCGVFATTPSDTGWIKVAVDIYIRKMRKIGGVNFDGWRDVIADKGRRIIKNSGETDPRKRYEAITVIDSDGRPRPVEEPVFLDGSGQKGDPNKPWYTGVVQYVYSEFNSIPWPQVQSSGLGFQS